MDERYHAAKLGAAAVSDKPSLIWEEHEEARSLLLTEPLTPSTRDALEVAALAILNRQRRHRINTGAN